MQKFPLVSNFSDITIISKKLKIPNSAIITLQLHNQFVLTQIEFRTDIFALYQAMLL